MHAGCLSKSSTTPFEIMMYSDMRSTPLPMPRPCAPRLTVSSSGSSHAWRLPSPQISSRCRPRLLPARVISAASSAPAPDSGSSSSSGPRFNPFKRSSKKEVRRGWLPHRVDA